MNHRSDPRVLGRRTLQKDHRVLASLLRPGLAVLDVGCGTGSITAGIAAAVGPDGLVVGLDRDESLLAIARQSHPNIRFEAGDIAACPFHGEFDAVTASRVLQWISRPEEALSGMVCAARTGAAIVVLDYNHADNELRPDPPAAFQIFYRAFLAWRSHHNWDNRIADRLPDLFRAAGLTGIMSVEQNEVSFHGEPASRLWLEVLESLGGQIVAEGFLTEAQRVAAQERYAPWLETDFECQALSLRAVTGLAA